MKLRLSFVFVFCVIGGQIYADKQEYVANLHDGNNNFLWHEGETLFNRLDPQPDRNVYLRIDRSSVHVRVLSRYGTREEDFKIVSRYEDGIVAELEDKEGIDVLQISPTTGEMKYLAIHNDGYLKVERYRLVEVPGIE